MVCSGAEASKIEYKYVKLTTSEDSTGIEWEPLGENRKIDGHLKASLVVSELYGVPERQNETFVMHTAAAI